MRFDPWKCPTCDQPAKGTLDLIPGLARLLFDDNGNADYLGETLVDWEGQRTPTDDQGRVTLCCPDGHQWQARAE